MWTQASGEHRLAYLIGALTRSRGRRPGTVVGLDRDRAFYPTVIVVIASYALFAVMGGSTHALLVEAGVASPVMAIQND